ncbi:MAG: aminopeptidase P family N-terminal domain-containing protein, partial [bacterium]|nr:aminopeptidase P family N-terminal domain-containing protein [bacterium]
MTPKPTRTTRAGAPAREHIRRIERVRTGLERRRLDALLVYDRANTFYLTGLHCTLSYLLVTRREAILWVDGRYIEAARAVAGHCDV